MGLEAVGLPDALHRPQGDADGLGDGAAGPVGHLARRLGTGQRQHLGDGCRRQRTFARRAGLVAQKAVDALFAVALLPAPHRRSADAGTTRHFENRQPGRRKKHDAGALHVLQRTAAIADDRCQSLAVVGSKDHTDGLGHASRIARPNDFVNPMIASVH